jgi:hypothetical protein
MKLDVLDMSPNILLDFMMEDQGPNKINQFQRFQIQTITKVVVDYMIYGVLNI